MREGVGQVEKEWLPAISADELNGLFGISLCQCSMVNRPFDHFAIPHQWHIPVFWFWMIVRVRL
jgi:hypothetical protein